jgi:SAM-dependent methyltransferase
MTLRPVGARADHFPGRLADVGLRDAWELAAPEWITWARKPGHDSYWRFHREAIFSLMPEPGVLTLDIGCGEGRVSRDLAALGHQVIALDGSPALAQAAADHPGTHGPTVIGDAANLPFRDGCADLVVAFMSLQDVDDFERAIEEAARVLLPSGVLLVAIVHPVNSVGRFAETDGDADPPFVITDSWFDRAPTADRCAHNGLEMTFHSEHRPLVAYTEALANSGFLIERVREPTDPDPNRPWHRIPMFLHIRAVKRQGQ